MDPHPAPEEIYAPPPAPPADVDVEGEADAEESGEAVTSVKRRSRTIVVTVIVVCAVLLFGAITAIVLLVGGLLRAVDGEPAPSPAAVQETPTPTPRPFVAGECGDLCAALADEVGTTAGVWSVEGAWTDAAADLGSTDAATAVFTGEPGRGTLTVLQFATDAEAAQAAIDVRERIGDPSYSTTVFDDGSGTRYDFDGALTSRVVWHLDDGSTEHVPGRLYLIEAPSNAADDFSGQAAFQLYLALPL